MGHRFLICRTWLLSDMELMYASFCRMNGIAMRKMDAETLERFDIMTQKDELKVVPHLRAAMVFERPAYKQRWGCCGVCLPTGLNAEDSLIVSSEGGTLVSRDSIEAVDYNDVEEDDLASYDDSASASDVLQSSKGGRASSVGSGSRAGEGSVKPKTFLSTTENKVVVCSIWPYRLNTLPERTGFLGGTWIPHFLLQYDFYPVDNIMRGLGAVASFLQLEQLVYNILQFTLGAETAEKLLNLLLAPLIYAVPLLCLMLLFVVQYASFMVMPLVPMITVLRYEWLLEEMNPDGLLVPHGARHHTTLPDFVFRGSISGQHMESWFFRLHWCPRMVFVFSTLIGLSLVLLIVEANFFKDAWHWKIQRQVRSFLNTCGMAIVGLIAWGILFLTSMVLFWFFMALVIYPEHMLIPLGLCIALIMVCHGAHVRYTALMDQIGSFLKDEVPEVLDIYLYVYIYICISLSLFIYVYMYIYIYTEREREREREITTTVNSYDVDLA